MIKYDRNKPDPIGSKTIPSKVKKAFFIIMACIASFQLLAYLSYRKELYFRKLDSAFDQAQVYASGGEGGFVRYTPSFLADQALQLLLTDYADPDISEIPKSTLRKIFSPDVHIDYKLGSKPTRKWQVTIEPNDLNGSIFLRSWADSLTEPHMEKEIKISAY